MRLLEQALKVQTVLDPSDDAKICDLLLDLCDALLEVPDTRRVIESEAPAAFSLAEGAGDGSRAVRACKTVLWATVVDRGTAGAVTPQYAEWAARADRYAQPGSVERAVADWALGIIKATGVDRREGVQATAPVVD